MINVISRSNYSKPQAERSINFNDQFAGRFSQEKFESISIQYRLKAPFQHPSYHRDTQGSRVSEVRHNLRGMEITQRGLFPAVVVSVLNGVRNERWRGALRRDTL